MVAIPTPKWLDVRTAYAAIAVIALGLIAAALVLQHGFDLDPCPLCIFQRIAYLVLAAFAFTAAWLSPTVASRWFGALALLGGLAGAGIAGRHVWLQMNPHGMSCGPGLEAMLENFPLTEVLPKVFRGSGDCADASTILGLTIAGWSLLWFAVLSIALVFVLFSRRFRPLIAR